jgi:hypothetical protein
MNDGLHTSFASKFHYALWRPLTAIHRAAEDGNPATEADASWKTLHAATPPYPTYAGNAATIGAASATVLADVFGGDSVPFTVDWSVYGQQFAGPPRPYAGFWAAADEQAVSRVYGGIHFSFDSDAGQQIGTSVAGYVMDHLLLPRDAADGGASAHVPEASAIAGSATRDVWQGALDGTGGVQRLVGVFNFDGSTVIRSDDADDELAGLLV